MKTQTPIASTSCPKTTAGRLARICHELPGRERRRTGSAGFQACCVADFQVGRLSPGSGARRVWKPAIQSRFGIGTLRTACEICGLARIFHTLPDFSRFG